MSKVASLSDAAALVEDGDVVGLQNMATQAAPMALVRTLIQQERRNVGLVCLVGGIAVDWLAATGVIDLAAFLGALVKIGYDGPVRAEPFNKKLRAMPNEEAMAATAAAMKKAFALVE